MENILDFKNNYSDVQLYEKLITLNYKDLYRFVHVMTRNTNLTDDIIQETLISAYTHFDKLNDKDKFKSWIFTIARRQALQTLKKTARECIVEKEVLDSILDKDNYFFDFSQTSILQDELIEIINGLDSESKEIINLRYYADLELEDISIILNMNYNTLRSKHKRVKDKIYKQLKSKQLIK